MDFNAKIEELRAQKSALLAKAQSMADEGKLEEVDAIGEQMAGINNSIKSLERLAAEAG